MDKTLVGESAATPAQNAAAEYGDNEETDIDKTV